MQEKIAGIQNVRTMYMESKNCK